MTEIHAGMLWVSSRAGLNDLRMLHDQGVSAVVDVALEEQPCGLPREFVYLRYPLNDGAGNNRSMLKLLLRSVFGLLDSGTPTAVACSAGLSRSPTVAAFGLAHVLSIDPAEAIERIADKKPVDIKDSLWAEVREAYRTLKSASD
ncbi:MAG: dual specificity protein phosphatase [Planctomycetota bacterium]